MLYCNEYRYTGGGGDSHVSIRYMKEKSQGLLVINSSISSHRTACLYTLVIMFFLNLCIIEDMKKCCTLCFPQSDVRSHKFAGFSMLKQCLQYLVKCFMSYPDAVCADILAFFPAKHHSSRLKHNIIVYVLLFLNSFLS